MSEIRPPLARRVLPWVVGAAFLVTAAIAGWRIVSLRNVAIERERDRIHAMVADRVSSWEDDLLATLTEKLEVATTEPDIAGLRQNRMRKSRQGINSLYLWEIPTKQDGEAKLLFPDPAIVENRELFETRQCIARAFQLRRVAQDPVRVAQLLTEGCKHDEAVVRIYAATQAAYLLLYAGRPADALRALDMARVPPRATLRNAAQDDIPPFRVAVYRMAHAEAISELGRTLEGAAEYIRLGEQIVSLEAPDLGPTLQFLRGELGVLAQLQRSGHHDDAARLQEALEDAERRLVAYDEIFNRIMKLERSPNSAPRFIRDQYSEAPYLLVFSATDGRGAALELEQDTLLKQFLARMRVHGNHITIIDASGNWVAGARRRAPFAVTVPFSRTLTHLRVGVRQPALDAAVSGSVEQWLVPLIVIAICGVVVGFALLTQVRLTRRQFELLNRQRAFTTRVTHELKTPLAGIRVMAENLELGAYRNDAHRSEMARRILEESDRLTERVEEVLAVTKEHTIPSPAPYDPEEAVLDAIDQWGPRLQQAGVRLEADLHPTETVIGDDSALRDAVGCLLDNALKYSKQGDSEARVWLELRQEGRQVQIAVADNGLGVPRNMRKAIFDRFVRVEGPNRGKAGGHGLGLNQVKQVVEAHKGTFLCDDGVDGGARFVIRLPAQRAA